MGALVARAGGSTGPLRVLRLERMAGISQAGLIALARMQVRPAGGGGGGGASAGATAAFGARAQANHHTPGRFGVHPAGELSRHRCKAGLEGPEVAYALNRCCFRCSMGMDGTGPEPVGVSPIFQTANIPERYGLDEFGAHGMCTAAMLPAHVHHVHAPDACHRTVLHRTALHRAAGTPSGPQPAWLRRHRCRAGGDRATQPGAAACAEMAAGAAAGPGAARGRGS